MNPQRLVPRLIKTGCFSFLVFSGGFSGLNTSETCPVCSRKPVRTSPLLSQEAGRHMARWVASDPDEVELTRDGGAPLNGGLGDLRR